jgi:hypothetical protein
VDRTLIYLMIKGEEKNNWEWVPCTYDMKRIVKEA